MDILTAAANAYPAVARVRVEKGWLMTIAGAPETRDEALATLEEACGAAPGRALAADARRGWRRVLRRLGCELTEESLATTLKELDERVAALEAKLRVALQRAEIAERAATAANSSNLNGNFPILLR